MHLLAMSQQRLPQLDLDAGYPGWLGEMESEKAAHLVDERSSARRQIVLMEQCTCL